MYAKDYYVAKTGNDRNHSTRAVPFKTIERGVRAMEAADTLYISGGTYIKDGVITVIG